MSGEDVRYGAEARPVLMAQASTSGQFQAGLPPTVQRGSGINARCRQMSTVGRLTPSRSATSAMPTGSQFLMADTVGKVLTDGKGCSDNHYMTESALTQANTRLRLGRVRHDTAGRITRITYRGYVEPADGSNDYAVPCCGGFDGHRTPDAAKKCAEKAWRRLPVAVDQ